MKYKNYSKGILLLIALLCNTISVSAGTDYYCDFQVNGIFYKFITGKTDEVAVSYDNYETGRYGGNYTNYSGSITVPSTVTYNSKTYTVTAVTDHAFYELSSVTYVSLPSTITSIGSYAFADCTSLYSINLPSSLKTIEAGAFNGCIGLSSISIPDGVTTIGGSAFAECKNISSFTIPNTVEKVGYGAFSGTAWLDKQPDGLLYIGKALYCYKGTMPSGTAISIKEGTTEIAGYAFSGCSGLTSITIPSSVTSIGNYAFTNCLGLTSMIIPDNVTSIADGLFYSCSNLTTLTIHSNVTTIGNSSFAYCSGLTDVYCYAEELPNTYSLAFYSSNINNATLHVPFSSLSQYEEASPWSSFMSIEPLPYNLLSCEDTECFVGTTHTLNVNLKNDDEAKLCQFDLRLPEGVVIATKSNGKLDATLTGRAENHTISSKQLSNGDYRFVVSSLENDSFTGNDGVLMVITIDVPEMMEAGEYTIQLLNAELSVPEGNDLKVSKPIDTESKLTIHDYTPGDVNNDRSVSVTDVGCAINYILEQIPSVFIFKAADMNNDNTVSVTDVGMIINLILNDGAASRLLEQQEAKDAQLSLQSVNNGYQLHLENKDAFIGFQFDMQPANGATINDIKLSDDNNHLLTYRKLDNGKYRIVCYSLSNSTFTGNGSALLDIQTAGDVAISNARFTTTGFSEVSFDDMSGATTDISEGFGITSTTSGIKVFTLDGRQCRINKLYDDNPLNGLKAGIYMIGNRKVILR